MRDRFHYRPRAHAHVDERRGPRRLRHRVPATAACAGRLNRYRNVDRDCEDLAAWRYRPIEVPALFVGGTQGRAHGVGGEAIARFADSLPRLHRSEILDGCGHWTQQERPAEVNDLLVDFLRSL